MEHSWKSTKFFKTIFAMLLLAGCFCWVVGYVDSKDIPTLFMWLTIGLSSFAIGYQIGNVLSKKYLK